MLHILIGNDSFSQEDYVKDLSVKSKSSIDSYSSDSLPRISSFFEQSLFGGKSITVLRDCLDLDEVLESAEKMQASSNIFVLIQDKLDKRKTTIQNFLKIPGSIVKEFFAPSIESLPAWIANHAKAMDVQIESSAIKRLCSLLVGEGGSFADTNTVNVWQVHTELEKLKTYAGHKKIDIAMVDLLVTKTAEPQIWDIIDAVATRRPEQILKKVELFLETDMSGDDKAKVIQLNALLADQFRNLLLVKAATASSVPDSEILIRTGWKPGRLSILKRASGGFNEKALLGLMQKLEALDIEMKTSSMPPRVLVDMICAQIS